MPYIPSTSGALPERADVPEAHRWALSDLYPDSESWDADVARWRALIDAAPAYSTRVHRSGDDLLQWLQALDTLNVLSGRIGNYAFRLLDEDSGNTGAQAMTERVMSIGAAHAAAVSWSAPAIVRIGRETIDRWVRETPALAEYAHMLDDILRAEAHVLPDAEERLLAMALEPTGAPSVIFGMFNDADIRFGNIEDEHGNAVEVTKGRYVAMLESRNRPVRERAFTALYSTYDAWKNTLAAMLAGQIKRDIFYARARRYASSLHAALDRDNIPVSVYDAVIASAHSSIAPLQRSIALRRDLLGIDAVRPWDLFVPLADDTVERFTFDEAKTLVLDGVAPLGPEYAQAMALAFDHRWIDIYENRGKAAGAYSAWTYGAHPFILMNYSGTLKDVFTLAHELGHAMHSWYTQRHQPPSSSEYTIFCAEIASTCNEILLVRTLLARDLSPGMRFQLLMHFIETIRGTVYNQALFAEFERLVHARAEEGEPLTASTLTDIMAGLYERYYGTAFVSHPLFPVNWSRIPHFYRGFYVFQYATGFSAAALIAQRLLSGDTAARDEYLRFLSAGNSGYSLDLLQAAGVDFTEGAPFDAVAALMTELLDEAEALSRMRV